VKSKFDLSKVLENVATGKTPIQKARTLIEKHYVAEDSSLAEDKKASKKISSGEGKGKIKDVIDNFKKKVNLDEILKKSTKIVHQISENVPQKIQDNLAPIGLYTKIEGVEAKISVFRDIKTGDDNHITDNYVTGSQLLHVQLSEKSELNENKFMAVQLSDFSLIRSDFCKSQLSLSKISHVSIQESCFVKNKIALSTWSDVSVTESDFTENILKRSHLSSTIVHSSRLSKLKFMQSHFKDCEFESCDIQGITFENCQFKECSFHHIKCISDKRLKISNVTITGREFAQCNTPEEFLALL
jgi:uncharacterized protein YjbI with pentapeptide repeats